jgi:hypothetical protein
MSGSFGFGKPRHSFVPGMGQGNQNANNNHSGTGGYNVANSHAGSFNKNFAQAANMKKSPRKFNTATNYNNVPVPAAGSVSARDIQERMNRWRQEKKSQQVNNIEDANTDTDTNTNTNTDTNTETENKLLPNIINNTRQVPTQLSQLHSQTKNTSLSLSLGTANSSTNMTNNFQPQQHLQLQHIQQQQQQQQQFLQQSQPIPPIQQPSLQIHQLQYQQQQLQQQQLQHQQAQLQQQQQVQQQQVQHQQAQQQLQQQQQQQAHQPQPQIPSTAVSFPSETRIYTPQQAKLLSLQQYSTPVTHQSSSLVVQSPETEPNEWEANLQERLLPIEEKLQQLCIKDERVRDSFDQFNVALRSIQGDLMQLKVEKGGAVLTEPVMKSWVTNFFQEHLGSLRREMQTSLDTMNEKIKIIIETLSQIIENQTSGNVDVLGTNNNNSHATSILVSSLSSQMNETIAAVTGDLKNQEQTIKLLEHKFQNTLQGIYDSTCTVKGQILQETRYYETPSSKSAEQGLLSPGQELLFFYPIHEDGEDKWMKIRLVDADTAQLQEAWVPVYHNKQINVGNFHM